MPRNASPTEKVTLTLLSHATPMPNASDSEVDHAQRRRGDQRLGQRGQTEDGVLAHRNAAFPISEPRGAAVDDLAILRDQHDRTDDTLLGKRAVERGIDCRRGGDGGGAHLSIMSEPWRARSGSAYSTLARK